MLSTPEVTYRSPQLQYGSVEQPDIDFRAPAFIENDFELLGVGEKFMAGIFQGFTTINLSRREPDNVAEGLAQSLGTWLGITGMAFTGPASWGTRFLATGASRGARMATSISRSNFKSVPMWVGDKAVQGIKAAGKSVSTPAMKSFVNQHRLGLDTLEGAVRIGSAMGIVSWQEGTNAMLQGAALGAFFGGSDRLIGNAIRGIRPELRKAIKSSDPKRLQKAERAVSMISAGIVSGMPSTLMGQPWEYQVYDYLFGAWLGAEPSYVMRTAHGLVGRMRAKGKENQLIHSKLRQEDPDYRATIDKHTNKKVRNQIEEEVQSQVDFVLGQRINNTTKAPVIAALAHSAAEAGNISAEKAIELNQAIFNETMDGQFLMDGLAKYKSEGEESGMTEKAAEAFAMDRIRDEYAEWRMGRSSSETMQRLADSIQQYIPEKTDYELYKPVFIGDEVGIITQIDDKGNVLKALASDGIELIKPSGKKSKIATAKEKADARALQTDVLPMKKSEFLDKIVAWRYSVDEQGRYINQGPDGESVDIPQRMWDLFPEVASQYQKPSFFIDSDGAIYPEISLGGKPYQRLDIKFDSEQKAYRYALEYLTETAQHRALNRDPAELHDAVILSRLADAYNDMDYDARSRPIFETVRDIIQDLDAKGQLTSREDIYTNPHELYNKIYNVLTANRDYNNRRLELTKELEKARRDQSENRDARIEKAQADLDNLTNNFGRPSGWDGFLQQMKEQFPMKTDRADDYWNQDTNPVVRDLRKWHRRVTKQHRVKNLTIMRRQGKGREGDRMELGRHDVFPNNQRNILYRAPSILQRSLWDINPLFDVIHVDNVYNLTRNEVESLTNLDNLSREDINRMLDQRYEDGDLPQRYFIASGVKDKDSLRAIPYMFSTRKSAQGYLEKRLRQLEKTQPEFVKQARAKLRDGSDDDYIQYATTMRVWEKLNNDSVGNRKIKGGKNQYKYPIEFLANQSGFINTVAALNKRMQIFDAEGMTADPTFYRNSDGSRKSSFKIAIVNLQNRSKKFKNQAEGIDEFTYAVRDGDQSAEILADQHRDGAVIASQRTFDQMKADGGLDPQSGAIKGVAVYSDADGAFVSKRAVFRASDEANQFMEARGIDFLENTSTAKQIGDRQVYDLQVKKDGSVDLIKNSRPVKNPQIYDMPIDGLTIDSGQSESLSSALKRQGLPVQMLQAFSPHVMDRNVASKTIEEIMSSGNRTTPEAQEFLARVEALDLARFDKGLSQKAIDDIRSEAKNLDIYDLSTQDIFQILRGDQIYEQTGLYDSVIRQMHRAKQDLVSEAARDGDINNSLEIMNDKFSSMLDVLIEVTADSGQLLTQRMLEQRGLKSYADAVYRNFIVSRTMRPRMDYSLKSIGSQQDPWFLQKHGRVEEGEFMLGQGARQMRVRVGLRDLTLGKAWDDFQGIDSQLADIRSEMRSLEKAISTFKGKEGSVQANLRRSHEQLRVKEVQLSKYKQELTSAMDMIVTRVPIEHASGVRSLRFKGFTDESGVTSKINPRDMANLGGMDLDIDSVFVFQNLGKTKYQSEDGSMKSLHDELKSSKVKDYWYNEDGTFRDPKSDKMQNVWKANYDKTRNMADMFSPERLYEAGRASASANTSLGLVVNARRDLLAAIDKFPNEKFSINDLDLTANQKAVLEEVYGTGAKVEFLRRDDSLSLIDEIARAGINMSADAADLTSFIGKFDIKTMMHRAGYKMKVTTGKGADQSSEKADIANSILRSNSPLMKAMQNANQALSGRIGDTGNVDAFEMVTHLRALNESVKDISRRSDLPETALTDLHGSYYRGLRDIVKTPIYYKPLDDINIDRLNRFYDVADKFFKSGSKLAKNYRKAIEDITGRNRRFYPEAFRKYLQEYNNTVRAFHNGNSIDGKKITVLDVRRAYKNLNEMMANDFNDLGSAMILYKESQRLLSDGVTSDGKTVKVTMADLVAVFNKSSQLKHMMYFVKNPEAAGEGYVPHLRTAEDIAAAWKDYRAKLHPQLRRFADYSAMSTLFKPINAKPDVPYNHPDMKQWNIDSLWSNHTHQAEFMKQATPLHVKEFFDMYNYLSKIPDSVPDQMVTDPDGRQRPALESHLRKMVADASTGEMALQFPYDYYDVPAPERVDMRIAALKKKAKAKWSEKTTPDAQEGSAMYNTLEAQKARILKEFGTFVKDGGEFKLSAEEQLMFRELRDLFSKHPQISQYFDMVFSGELSVTRRDGRSKTIEQATLDDLRKFIASVRGTYHGDLMSGSKIESSIPKWMYWMVPDKYHRKYANLDMQLDDVVVRTIDGKDRRAKMISSPAKRLVNFSNTIQLGIEIKTAKITEEMVKDLDQIHKDLGDDFDTVWRYVVMDRIVQAGRASEDVKLKHAKFQKEIQALADKVYRVDGKDTFVADLIPKLSEKITEMNKKVWNTVHNPDQVNYYYDKSKKWVNSDAVLAKMKESIMSGDVNNLWIPDTWTLNNMVMQDYVHKQLTKSLEFDVPVKGSEPWIAEANKFIRNAGMEANLDLPNLPFDSYYPYRNHSKAALKKWRIDEKNRQNMLTNDHLRNQEYASMRLYEDAGLLSTLGDDLLLSDVLGLTDGIPEPKDLDVGQRRLPRHLRKRSEVHEQIPDWDPGIRSYFEYVNEMVKSNHNKALALVGASEIDAMQARMKDTYQESSKHYADFLRMYLSDQVMTQTMVPTTWKDNYAALNLKESGYYYFTDRYYTELDQRISKKLGTEPLLQDNNLARPLRLAEIANLEAKYSLITLLSRPKTGIMNIWGGGTILASDVGLSNMMKGWQISAIRKINPDLKTWDDAIRFAENHGAMESLVRNEVMTSQAWGNKKNRKALTEMLNAIKKDPTTSDLTLSEIAKRHGLSDNIMNLAALPMRYSERLLRTRSFFAHYIKAVETLEVSGPSAANHPWVIKMAQQGVKTSQFLYNNANRPAFARSNVGKIVARFRLWAINSVNFRADAFNEMAGDLAYNVQDPATQKRFNNIMMMDMFMLALAGLFPFSVFGNSIPEPFGWMSELVDWAFGDEPEEAFRGGSGFPTALAPLSVALPASSRLLTSWIEPVMQDDWSNFTGYHVWTLFPFGLLARDARNAVVKHRSPINTLTGIPHDEIQNQILPAFIE